MEIEMFLNADSGSLIFEKIHFCMNAEEAAYLVDQSLIVDPEINRVRCHFKGTIIRHFQKDGQPINKVLTYDKVIFTSSLCLNTKAFRDSPIKTIVFLKDVEILEGDPSFLKGKELIGPYCSPNIHQYLKEHELENQFRNF